jgi:hypothetical protein
MGHFFRICLKLRLQYVSPVRLFPCRPQWAPSEGLTVEYEEILYYF